ncbi:hypothetical protein HK100_004093 [Physocladia obscura]|uniref:Uncharacterized protein n=1 Tax=Physocladia obscura TaxID=109957 RepID=A0AAD5T929_9FUNG|nr:hypothetical protein HK100_004093 [Physocladia obscura]
MGISAINRCIKLWKFLREICLTHTNLDSDAIIILAETLAISTVAKVDVAYNSLNSDAATALLEYARTNKNAVFIRFLPVLANTVETLNTDVENIEMTLIDEKIKQQCSKNRETIISLREKKSNVVNGTAITAYANIESNMKSGEEIRCEEIQDLVDGDGEETGSIFGNDVETKSLKNEGELTYDYEKSALNIIKFQNEILAAKEQCILLDEMVKNLGNLNEFDGESSIHSLSDRDLAKSLYEQTKNFKIRLEYILSRGFVKDEETVASAFILNDYIEQTLATSTSVFKMQDSKKSFQIKTELESSNKPSSIANIPPAQLNAAVFGSSNQSAVPARALGNPWTVTNDRTDKQGPQMSFVTASASMPLAMLQPESETDVSVESLKKEHSNGTIMFPAIPPAQILLKKSAGITMTSQQKKGGSVTQKSIVEVQKATTKKSISLSSFEDVVDGEDDVSRNIDDQKSEYVDDKFLAELNSQMQEIDEFLYKK